MMSACQVRLEVLSEWDVEILELSGEALKIAYFFTLVRGDFGQGRNPYETTDPVQLILALFRVVNRRLIAIVP